MQYPALLTSDLHLVSNASASYRFDLFPWLVEQIREEKVKTLLILGDLTDAKDNHSAELVNRIVRAITSIQEGVPWPVQTKILAGNHDWLREGHEFFKFLNVLKNVEFITEPSEDKDPTGPDTYYLPYSKQPAKDWQDLDFSHYDYVFMHQTIKGSISSNGQEMEGEDLPDLSAARKVYSGDIHVPQVIGPIEYVGSPYHVHFGDAFKPRVILLERNGKPLDLHFQTISRVTVKVESLAQLERAKLRAGDQVKLRIELAEGDKHEWSRIKREALAMLKAKGVEVHGAELLVRKAGARLAESMARQISYSPSRAVERFVEAEELTGDALEMGLRLLEAKA